MLSNACKKAIIWIATELIASYPFQINDLLPIVLYILLELQVVIWHFHFLCTVFFRNLACGKTNLFCICYTRLSQTFLASNFYLRVSHTILTLWSVIFISISFDVIIIVLHNQCKVSHDFEFAMACGCGQDTIIIWKI